jgi:hypothetical protein
MRPFFHGKKILMKHSIFSLALAATLLSAVPAFAQWQITGDAGLRYVRNTETGTGGKRLVREDGWLPGLGVTVGYVAGDWRVGMAGEIYSSDIDYDGQLQSGASFRTNTGTTQTRLRFDMGRQVTQNVQLLAAIEYDLWRRDIHGNATVLGIQEKTSSWRLLTGAKGRVAQWDAGTLDLQGFLVFSTAEQLRVRFDQQVYDDANFHTKSTLGVRLGATFQPSALPDFSVTAEFDWLEVGRSDDAVLRKNGMAVGTVTQPKHERASFGLRAAYRF